jgi:hypothetical protein
MMASLTVPRRTGYGVGGRKKRVIFYVDLLVVTCRRRRSGDCATLRRGGVGRSGCTSRCWSAFERSSAGAKRRGAFKSDRLVTARTPAGINRALTMRCPDPGHLSVKPYQSSNSPTRTEVPAAAQVVTPGYGADLAPALAIGDRVTSGCHPEEPPHDEDRGPFDAVRCPRWRNIDSTEATTLKLCCRGLSYLGRRDRAQPHVSLYPLRATKAGGCGREGP